MSILLLTGLILVLIPSTAEAAPYLDVLEHIAEDIEEIHEDMHVVAFNLRLMAWANVAQAFLLAVIAIALVAGKDKKI